MIQENCLHTGETTETPIGLTHLWVECNECGRFIEFKPTSIGYNTIDIKSLRDIDQNMFINLKHQNGLLDKSIIPPKINRRPKENTDDRTSSLKTELSYAQVKGRESKSDRMSCLQIEEEWNWRKYYKRLYNLPQGFVTDKKIWGEKSNQVLFTTNK